MLLGAMQGKGKFQLSMRKDSTVRRCSGMRSGSQGKGLKHILTRECIPMSISQPGFCLSPAEAGSHSQMPSDGTHGEIPPCRGASAHRALGFRSRKYLVSTLGVQHFRRAQETVLAAGAAALPFHLSGTGKQGAGGGSAAETGRVNMWNQRATGGERGRKTKTQLPKRKA